LETRTANELRIMPQVDFGPNGQLQVVVNVPYKLKDEFKGKLSWPTCKYRWDTEYKTWLVNLNALQYVAGELGLEIPTALIKIFGEEIEGGVR